MKEPLDILHQYWGYDAFRPMQLEIIQSVASGVDTLALLPTGGGKSICFQVPALMTDGICIVISPLIALMKDQVQHLKERGIKALCVTSELDQRQIDGMFDTCIYDKDIKFLYMSPERLKTDLARARIPQMNVNLLAVDEAHCISEWGYDFRPPYLEIAEIRHLIPTTPVIALTASATPVVVKDIQEKLEFRKDHQLHQKSFARENLSYRILFEEDKFGMTERIAKALGGSGIIYMRSRKGTERIARELKQRGLSVDFYHAGLDADQRTQRQERWMQGKIKIIAATNAFGMGIDKPDVRFVIHFDIPDTLENYYQECGRAGRDGERAYVYGLFHEDNVTRFREKLIHSFPEKEEIKRVYNALATYLSLATGSGKGEKFQVDFQGLCRTYQLDARSAQLSLSFLDREGYIQWSSTSEPFATVKVSAEYQKVYDYRMTDDRYVPLMDGLLRSYARLFEETSSINEWTLAKRLKWRKDDVVKGLTWLDQHGYITYKPVSGDAVVVFSEERLDPKNIRLSKEHYTLRKHVVKHKAEAMLDYVLNKSKCRSRMLLEYFGEKDASNCGRCDFCLKNADSF